MNDNQRAIMAAAQEAYATAAYGLTLALANNSKKANEYLQGIANWGERRTAALDLKAARAAMDAAETELAVAEKDCIRGILEERRALSDRRA